jgi:electron transport complex protein RnfB
VDEMQAILDDLVMKGQIGTFKQGGKQMYKMFPFAVGIYEEQFLRKDKDEKWLKGFCELFEEYLPFFGEYLVGFEPAYFRVVPVSTEIKKDLHVHRYDDIRGMVEEAKSFLLQDCMCRREQGLQGKRYSTNR